MCPIEVTPLIPTDAQQLAAMLIEGEALATPDIDAETLSETALYAWRDTWLEEGTGYAELARPLRIFKVGIAYLSKQDERVLIDLVSTERAILRQALGLEPES